MTERTQRTLGSAMMWGGLTFWALVYFEQGGLLIGLLPVMVGGLAAKRERRRVLVNKKDIIEALSHAQWKTAKEIYHTILRTKGVDNEQEIPVSGVIFVRLGELLEEGEAEFRYVEQKENEAGEDLIPRREYRRLSSGKRIPLEWGNAGSTVAWCRV